MCQASFSNFNLLLITSVDCGHPVAPQNGSLETYNSTINGSEVFYSCDPGLVPEGRMKALCTESGWSPNPAGLNCTVGTLLWVDHVSVPCVMFRDGIDTQYCSFMKELEKSLVKIFWNFLWPHPMVNFQRLIVINLLNIRDGPKPLVLHQCSNFKAALPSV